MRLGEHKDEDTEKQFERVPYVGIFTQTDIRHQIPVDVRIDTQRVSGPSAGLAFSLAIIDDLTAGNLTGGTRRRDHRHDPRGRFGRPRGGREAEGGHRATRAGARLMIVPIDEVEEARSRARAT